MNRLGKKYTNAIPVDVLKKEDKLQTLEVTKNKLQERQIEHLTQMIAALNVMQNPANNNNFMKQKAEAIILSSRWFRKMESENLHFESEDWEHLKKAYTQQLSEVMNTLEKESIDEEFIQNWVMWIQGYTECPHVLLKTWWWWAQDVTQEDINEQIVREGRTPKQILDDPAWCKPVDRRRLFGKEFNVYLEEFVARKYQFQLDMLKLRAFIPNNLDTSWKFWKYVVSEMKMLETDYMTGYFEPFLPGPKPGEGQDFFGKIDPNPPPDSKFRLDFDPEKPTEKMGQQRQEEAEKQKMEDIEAPGSTDAPIVPADPVDWFEGFEGESYVNKLRDSKIDTLTKDLAKKDLEIKDLTARFHDAEGLKTYEEGKKGIEERAHSLFDLLEEASMEEELGLTTLKRGRNLTAFRQQINRDIHNIDRFIAKNREKNPKFTGHELGNLVKAYKEWEGVMRDFSGTGLRAELETIQPGDNQKLLQMKIKFMQAARLSGGQSSQRIEKLLTKQMTNLQQFGGILTSVGGKHKAELEEQEKKLTEKWAAKDKEHRQALHNLGSLESQFSILQTQHNRFKEEATQKRKEFESSLSKERARIVDLETQLALERGRDPIVVLSQQELVDRLHRDIADYKQRIAEQEAKNLAIDEENELMGGAVQSLEQALGLTEQESEARLAALHMGSQRYAQLSQMVKFAAGEVVRQKQARLQTQILAGQLSTELQQSRHQSSQMVGAIQSLQQALGHTGQEMEARGAALRMGSQQYHMLLNFAKQRQEENELMAGAIQSLEQELGFTEQESEARLAALHMGSQQYHHMMSLLQKFMQRQGQSLQGSPQQLLQGSPPQQLLAFDSGENIRAIGNVMAGQRELIENAQEDSEEFQQENGFGVADLETEYDTITGRILANRKDMFQFYHQHVETQGGFVDHELVDAVEREETNLRLYLQKLISIALPTDLANEDEKAIRLNTMLASDPRFARSLGTANVTRENENVRANIRTLLQEFHVDKYLQSYLLDELDFSTAMEKVAQNPKFKENRKQLLENTKSRDLTRSMNPDLLNMISKRAPNIDENQLIGWLEWASTVLDPAMKEGRINTRNAWRLLNINDSVSRNNLFETSVARANPGFDVYFQRAVSRWRE